jgi:integrating conjugative element protein (TIGR03757 family)
MKLMLCQSVRWLLLVIVIAPLGALQAGAERRIHQIEVLTFSNRPVTNAGSAQQMDITVKVFEFDQHFKLEEQLSQGLPADNEALATRLAQERVAAIPKEEWETLWQAQALARRYGIVKAPAVVFNQGESVIYGITDLQEAIRLWTNFTRK